MTVRALANPAALPQVPSAPFDPPTQRPRALHRLLPGYAPTPLRRAPGIAHALGVREVLVKDESSRLGLPSYKILGASWATCRRSTTASARSSGRRVWTACARSCSPYGPWSLAAATDGNHGRAVARMARWLGWPARVFVPAGTAAARIEGIASEGATVEVVLGSYDDADRRAAQEAGERTLVIADTAWPGYDVVPRRVVEGYSTIFWEVDEQLAQAGLPGPDVVAVQMGVGSLAAAVVLHYRCRGLATPPTLVGAEPVDAACVLASVAAGRLTAVPGPHTSTMAGLNCGETSPLAFPLLRRGLDVLLTVDDDTTATAVRLLAAAGTTAGESGAAGLGALLRPDATPTCLPTSSGSGPRRSY